MDRGATTRRRLLAGIAGTAAGATATAGCLRRVRNVAGRDSSTQLGLELVTTPDDSDPHAIRIARHFAENLRAAGIDATVTAVSETALYRDVLFNHDFDVYVGQLPEPERLDPDVCYPLLHADFAAEPGWQNPFGFSDLSLSDRLDAQRAAAGDERRVAAVDLQESIAREQPFVTVAFPDALTAARRSRFEGWSSAGPTAPLGLLGLDRIGGGEPTLRLVTTDPRVTENRNPIAAEYRRHGTFVGLLYDPLVRPSSAGRLPWLARDWAWDGEAGAFRVRLRDATWTDGEPVTAADVAFTYRFLADTSLGRAESPIPAPRFRGRSTLVADAVARADDLAVVTPATPNPEVAVRALTLPVLPAHVWRERTGPATVAGIEVNAETTEAVVHDNAEPIGSGPLAFVEAEPGERLVLERRDGHFLTGTPDGIPDRFHGGPAYDRLELEWVMSDVAAVERVAEDVADATVSTLGPDTVPRIGREGGVRLASRRSLGFYHVGFNARRAPLSNPRFRRVAARLLDKAALVESAFRGYATPAATPLATSAWAAPSLAWDGGDPSVSFLGSGGELDVAAAREAFREAGYRYDDRDRLLVREQ